VDPGRRVCARRCKQWGPPLLGAWSPPTAAAPASRGGVGDARAVRRHIRHRSRRPTARQPSRPLLRLRDPGDCQRRGNGQPGCGRTPRRCCWRSTSNHATSRKQPRAGRPGCAARLSSSSLRHSLALAALHAFAGPGAVAGGRGSRGRLRRARPRRCGRRPQRSAGRLRLSNQAPGASRAAALHGWHTAMAGSSRDVASA
jgi:hypothetical protein